MTVVERALELVPDGATIGLGSGRAAQAFIRGLAKRVGSGQLQVRAVATSNETAALAEQLGIPLTTLAEVDELALTVDGADEVDPNLDLIKGYGRAMVREKIVAATSRHLVILVGTEKLVSQIGARGKLPVEVVPFAVPLCERRLRLLGCRPVLWSRNGEVLLTDNGNAILDCGIDPVANPAELETGIRSIPGVVGTGFFLGMARTVLVGEGDEFRLVEERRRAV